MWDWLKRLFSTNASPKQDGLLALLLAQQKLIEQTVLKQQDVIAQQQTTLDRIVTARYDRPVERVVHPIAADPLPGWAMNDQGDVRPSDPIGAGIGALHVDSDEEFLKAVANA